MTRSGLSEPRDPGSLEAIHARGPPGYRYADFMKKVAASLHRAGVPLIAGTDAMGYPLVVPGAALIRELELLVEIGMSPYEAIQAATVAPAVLLGRRA